MNTYVNAYVRHPISGLWGSLDGSDTVCSHAFIQFRYFCVFLAMCLYVSADKMQKICISRRNSSVNWLDCRLLAIKSGGGRRISTRFERAAPLSRLNARVVAPPSSTYYVTSSFRTQARNVCAQCPNKSHSLPHSSYIRYFHKQWRMRKDIRMGLNAIKLILI